MKICHVISGYFRNDARVFERQCKSLKKESIEVTLLTNDGEKNEIIDDIKIHSTDLFFSNRIFILLFATFQFFGPSKKIDADIYQLHSPELVLLGLILKLKGKKIIYDAHEDLPRHIIEKEWLLWMPFFLRKIISIFIEFFLLLALKFYDEVITPHEHVNDHFIRNNINSSLIANFPIIKSFNTHSFEEYKNREDALCYTGTVYSYSNQEEILQAMKDFEFLKYKIAGYIEPNHLKSLAELENFNSLDYLGRIPWKRLNEFYDKTTIGIVIYDYKLNLGNNLGSYGTNKIFEYMEAGLPLICTDFILWKKIIDKYKCGICVEPRSVFQIREAIKYLISNKKIAYQMGQNARKAVEKEFNWHSQEKEYTDLFKRHAKK